jgi:hypothetical protein
MGTAHQDPGKCRVRSRCESAGKTATHRSGQKRLDTYGMIAILEEKRAEVMSNQDAAYFIHDWQELQDRVRKMMNQDARYQAIKASL